MKKEDTVLKRAVPGYAQAQQACTARPKVKKRTVLVSDYTMVGPEERWSRSAVYSVYNVAQGTETFVDGRQAEVLSRYTADYAVAFVSLEREELYEE